MSSESWQRWSSKNNSGLTHCSEQEHIFTCKLGDDPAGVICECGRMIWSFTICENCKRPEGKAVEARYSIPNLRERR